MPDQILYSNPNAGTVTIANADGTVTLLPGSPISPYLQFPIFNTKYAASSYSRKNVDQTIVNETDGGYDYSRPKNTNFKKREWSLAFPLMPDGELSVLRDFTEMVGNQGGCFSWVEPTTQEMYLVRFTSVPNEVYVGAGAQGYYWNVDFKVRSIRLLSTSYTGYVKLQPFGTEVGGQYSNVSITPALPSSASLAMFVNGLLVPESKYIATSQNTLKLLDFTVSSLDTLTGFAYTPKFSTAPGEQSLALITGTIDGINRTFQSSINTNGSALVMLFWNGLLVDPNRYQNNGANFTMQDTPLPTDILTMYVW